MEYRYVKASEIVDFASRFTEGAAPVLPVSPWRARSQAENPDAHPGDTLLIVALDKAGNIAGYIGLLPFRPGEKSTDRIFWNTCWWVNPEAGASVSLALFSKFLEATGKRVAFSDMTEKTAEILRRLKGYRLSTRSGAMIRFRYAYHDRILKSKNSGHAGKWLASTGLVRLADMLLNIGVNRRLNHWSSNHSSPCRINVTGELGAHHVDFAIKHGGKYFSQPSVERFNWWKQYPWLVPPGKTARRIADRYYFSSVAMHNDLFVVEYFCNESLAGFAILSNRDGVVKTQYLYYREDQHEAYFLSLLNYMLQNGAHTLITFHEDFARFVKKQKLPVVQLHELERYTALSEHLMDQPGIEGKLQDGDGDYIFT